MKRVSGGYTVVETMIVLSVSMVIFISAMLLVQGQQGRTQFTDAMRDIQSKMVDWSNDVGTGFYPDSTTGYKCATDTGTGLAKVDNGPAGQGTNEQCIYIGKVIQFRPGSDKVSAYTVFGNRTLPDGTLVTSLSDAKPVVAFNPAGPDLTESYEMRWGAEVQAIPSPPIAAPSTSPTYLLAFYHAIGTPPAGGTSSSLFYMYSLADNKDFTGANQTDQVNLCVQADPSSGCSGYPTTALNLARICFKSATSNQYAVLTLTPSGDSVNTQLDYVDTCS